MNFNIILGGFAVAIAILMAPAFAGSMDNVLIAQSGQPIKPQLQITEGIDAPKYPAGDISSPARALPPLTGKSEAARIWELVSNTNDVEVLDRFIAKYPGTFQASLAAQKRGQLARAEPPREPDPVQRIQPVMPAVPVQEPPDLAFAIQTELRRLGCNPGKIDGKWGGKSAEAARLYAKYAGSDDETAQPNRALFNSLRSSTGQVCPLICGITAQNVNGQCVAKSCPKGQRLSSKGRCYTVKSAKTTKTCRRGQRLSSKGNCYTPKAAKTCGAGERLSSKGNCYVPKPRKTATAATPPPKQSTKPAKQSRQCTWCAGTGGQERYICGASRIARARARGQCK